MKYVRGWKKAKSAVVIAALGGLAVVGLAPVAIAQVAGDGPIKGTIAVQEGADYKALARVTLEQARDAALAEVPGATFQEGELDEEDGYLVYDIELVQNGKEVDVAVDAGDGSVLQVDPDDDRIDD